MSTPENQHLVHEVEKLKTFAFYRYQHVLVIGQFLPKQALKVQKRLRYTASKFRKLQKPGNSDTENGILEFYADNLEHLGNMQAVITEKRPFFCSLN